MLLTAWIHCQCSASVVLVVAAVECLPAAVLLAQLVAVFY